MRLFNVNTYRLESFDDEGRPPYAILSHTWGKDEEEVSFGDIEVERDMIKIKNANKLNGCCAMARDAGLEYVWIDTCCIDKTNSVELGEAINSMFRWYRESETCFAYLADAIAADGSDLPASRWFTRGWTLQELLAPRQLDFYTASWKHIGDRSRLSRLLEKTTGIGRPYLLGMAEVHEASVAQRMSWAAKRKTKRKEDIAYCLLGIFHINMPMIYGEGDNAFFRLQQEIMRTTRDDSILAWGRFGREYSDWPSPTSLTPPTNEVGLVLAAAPSDFMDSGDIISRDHDSEPTSTDELELVGGRLRIRLRVASGGPLGTFGVLNCRQEGNLVSTVAIPLAIDNTGPRTGERSTQYIRPRWREACILHRDAPTAEPEVVYIRNERAPTPINRRNWFYIKDMPNLELVEVVPPHRWQKCSAQISTTMERDGNPRQDTFLRVRHQEASCDFVVVLSFDANSQKASYHLLTVPRDADLKQLAVTFGYLQADLVRKGSARGGAFYLEAKVWTEVVARQPMFAVALVAFAWVSTSISEVQSPDQSRGRITQARVGVWKPTSENTSLLSAGEASRRRAMAEMAARTNELLRS